MCAAHRHPAEVIPLLRVVTFSVLQQLVEEGQQPLCWALTQNSFAKTVEEACGWDPCTYYYAGHAHPYYGDVVFAYGAAIEEGKKGLATPCDSGDLYAGEYHPLRPAEGETYPHPQAVAFLTSHTFPLPQWRGKFARYLQDHFAADWQRYLAEEVPNFAKETTAWGDSELPARHEENHEKWPAWVWEIKIQERTPMEEGILIWGGATDTIRKLRHLRKEGTKGSHPGPRLSKMNHLAPVEKEDIDSAIQAVENWIQAWIKQELQR
jgi:hypothetical protein